MIIFGLVLAKTVKVSFGNFKLFAEKEKSKDKNSNEINIQGNINTIKQDINNKTENRDKENRINVIGENNQLFQDTDNK